MTMPAVFNGDPLPPSDLRVQVNEAWRVWQSSPTRYSQVGGLLGELIVETERALRAAASSEAGHDT